MYSPLISPSNHKKSQNKYPRLLPFLNLSFPMSISNYLEKNTCWLGKSYVAIRKMSEVKVASQIWIKDENINRKGFTKKKKKKWETNGFKLSHILTEANHNSTITVMNLQRQTNNSMLKLISVFSGEMKAPNRNFLFNMISLIIFFMVKICIIGLFFF
jgi:hypothetical protein